ncbi:hypothetical protein C8R46DRAFT_1027577 [Mycena filopes]|nr:hypothetical protein C8R46DRAFT_1027577 [Mycena filopes]
MASWSPASPLTAGTGPPQTEYAPSWRPTTSLDKSRPEAVTLAFAPPSLLDLGESSRQVLLSMSSENQQLCETMYHATAPITWPTNLNRQVPGTQLLKTRSQDPRSSLVSGNNDRGARQHAQGPPSNSEDRPKEPKPTPLRPVVTEKPHGDDGVETGEEEGLGCVGLEYLPETDAKAAEIRRMLVTTKHRRLGLASRLMLATIQHAETTRGIASESPQCYRVCEVKADFSNFELASQPMPSRLVSWILGRGGSSVELFGIHLESSWNQLATSRYRHVFTRKDSAGGYMCWNPYNMIANHTLASPEASYQLKISIRGAAWFNSPHYQSGMHQKRWSGPNLYFQGSIFNFIEIFQR